MFLLNTMRALEICPLTLPSWKRNVNDRGLERALAILSMRSYAIGRLHDFASEPFSAGFRTNLCGKHRNGSTQKAPRQQTFKFEEVRGRHHREARLCSLLITCSMVPTAPRIRRWQTPGSDRFCAPDRLLTHGLAGLAAVGEAKKNRRFLFRRL